MSIVLGVFVAVSPLPLVSHNVINESLLRIFLGTLIFLGVAILASGLATKLQHYPLGVFANHQPDFRNWARNF